MKPKPGQATARPFLLSPRIEQIWDAVYSRAFAAFMVENDGAFFKSHSAETARDAAEAIADEAVARFRHVDHPPNCICTGCKP